MTEQNNPGQSERNQEGWDPYKAFDDAMAEGKPSDDTVEEEAEELGFISDDHDATNEPSLGGDPRTLAPANPHEPPSVDQYPQTSTTDRYGQAAAAPYAQPSAAPYGQPSADPYGQPSADPYGQAYGQGQYPYGQQSAGQYYQGAYGAPATYGAGQFNPAWVQGPTEAGASTLTLNYWLSVFFSWIPALIFYLSEKDKNALVADHVKENMNFQLTRVIVGLVTAIPVIGWIVGGIASVVLFVFAIMGAVQGPQAYRAGQVYRFPFSLRIIN